MMSYEITTKIPTVTDAQSANEAIKILLEPVDLAAAEELADQYNLRMYRGNDCHGETYYPKGTNVEENYLEYVCECYDYDVEDGNLVEGIWISSSEMC